MIESMGTAQNLRATFNEDAELYNRYRPQYPEALFSTLVQTAHVTETSNLLEIGPGTGQATEPLAKLGCTITGVELGKSLADKARARLSAYANVRIITSSFENADLPPSTYDVIFSATAFHWIRDEHKFTKTAALLKPRSYLAIIHTEHISDDHGDMFFEKSKPMYSAYMPADEPVNVDKKLQPPSISDIKPPAIDTQLFELKSFDIFPVTMTYSANDYSGLLSTYSPTIALPVEKRQQFLTAIATLINEQFDGQLQKRFAFTLTMLQKK